MAEILVLSAPTAERERGTLVKLRKSRPVPERPLTVAEILYSPPVLKNAFREPKGVG